MLAYLVVRAGRRLNLLMAFFLPLTAAGSIFSMHLANGFENRNAPWLFFGVVCAALLTGVLLVVVIVFNLDSAATRSGVSRESPTRKNRPAGR